PLPSSEIDATLRHYLPPAPFASALETLRSRGLVILRGSPALGQRAGALALLSKCDVERPFVGLAPTLTLDELNRRRFRARHAYVIQDRAQGLDTAETLDYELDALSRTLIRASAYLVITT